MADCCPEEPMNRTHLRHDLFTMAAASLGLLLTACGGAAAQPDAAMTGSEGTCSAHGASMQDANCSTSAPRR